MAWKAFRNLRRSWLSREVALFGLYAPLAALAVLVPGAAPVAAAVGVVGGYASARLYIVPGRPSWDSPRTIASRSEARRVGKECVSTWRYGWSPDHLKQKTCRSRGRRV